MPGYWSITNRPAAGSPASASQTAPTSGLGAGMQVRLRQIQANLSGPVAGTDLLVIRDGASGVGTIIWQVDLSIIANGFAFVSEAGFDVRASAGNALTVEFVNGLGGDREDINAGGDYVSIGWPVGMS